MRFSFLIVDDETLSRHYIHDLIMEFEPDAVIEQAASAKDALAYLETHKPDVMFLDINMPGVDGFSLLDSVTSRDFELVFITAFSHYAVKAFKEGACDYLLKPVKKSEFRLTLEKALHRRLLELERKKYSASQAGSYYGQKLVINHQTGIKIISIPSILYLKADNSYTTIYTIDKEEIVISKPISHFEKTLHENWFFRIHKSYIINMSHLKEYSAVNGRIAVMKDDTRLSISRYRLGEFLQRLKVNS